MADGSVAQDSPPRSPKPGRSIGSWLPFVLIPGAVWLAWQIVVAPVAQRAGPELALRVAPTSPAVLSRAAELEFQAGRDANARDLASDALSRAPFNLRALRVLGLITDRDGQAAQADEILTLAGNWSLRDTPTHGWLVNQRLRAGDYGSSFAHLDTLIRRRVGGRETFDLLAVAAREDPRAIGHLRDHLATNPPWTRDFIQYLQLKDGTESLTATLVAGLEPTPGRLTDVQLSEVYGRWVRSGRIGAVKVLRQAISRPAPSIAVTNGDFSSDAAVLPFDMRILTGPGIAVERVDDDQRTGNRALRIAYDGFGSGVATEQLLLLSPGSYRLETAFRIEAGSPDTRLSWQIRCLERPEPILEQRLITTEGQGTNRWKAVQTDLVIPADCSAQWLRLTTRPGDRRAPVAVWVDDVAVVTRD